MERFNIKKLSKDNNCGYALIRDNEKNIEFWIEYNLIDGYGNHINFKTEDLYADWEFNQYIFHLDYEQDIKAKLYQDNVENIEYLQEFIDENNDKLVNYII